MTPEELKTIKKQYCTEHIPLVVVHTGDGMAVIENTESYDVAYGMTDREAGHFVGAVERIIPALVAEIGRLQTNNGIMREELQAIGYRGSEFSAAALSLFARLCLKKVGCQDDHAERIPK